MPGHSGELFTHLRALAPERLDSPLGRLTYTQYLHRYCNVKTLNFGMRTVTKILGNKNNAELRDRLKGFYIRRTKEQVLKQLPPLLWGTVVLEPPRDAMKTLKAVEGDPKLKEIYSVLAAASLSHHQKDDQAADEILASANKDAIASLRRAVGLAKVKPTVEFVESELDSGIQKIILFCYHREVIAQIEKALASYGVVSITGDTSKTKRQEAIDRFQTDPSVRIFAGQTTAANAAITLTAASQVLIVEPSFVPSENVQASARAHRIGQENCVNARYVTLAGSLDELITRILIRKTRQISEVIY
jgi:SNF2 family DNA or RNA helicase